MKHLFTRGYSTWRPATQKQMVKILTDKFNHTPKWRIFKRRQLKAYIRFWEGIKE